MRCRLLILCLSTLVAAVIQVHAAQDETPPFQLNEEIPHYKIGIITDGPIKSFPGLIDIYRSEIEQIAGDEFTVSFPREMSLEGDGTLVGIKRLLEKLLNNQETDLILTLGTIGSTEALKRKAPGTPIIAPYVLDPILQHAPEQDTGSGVHNLTYVASGTSTNQLLTTFRKIVPFTRLAILIAERDITGIGAIQKRFNQLANEHTITIDTIPVGSSADKVLASLPSEVEAVMVGPLWQLDTDEFARLSQGLTLRQLPSFSMWDYRYVEQGLFATSTPENIHEHLARRVAVTSQEILLGEDAATLPVVFSKTQKLAFNIETARAIDIYPSLAQMTGSILLNEQRQDIERRLTLPEAVQEALIANLDLAVAERRVTAGTYAVGEARSPLLPQVGIGASGRVIDDDRAVISGGTTPERAWFASASASQQIYSEKSWSAYTVEQHRQTGRESNRDTVRLNIILEAGNAYLNLLRQKTIEQLQKENMLLTQANLERAQIRLSTGVAGPDELYRWQTKFANDRQIVLRAESNTFDAMQRLNRILHRPLQEEFIAEETDLSDPLLITGDQLFYQLMHNPRYLKDFNAFAMEEGLKLSPELQVIDAEIAAQERIIVRSKREYWLPDFTVEGNVDQVLSDSGEGQRDEAVTGLDDTDWSVGVFARLPLFEGGRKSATLSKTREQLNQLKTERMATAERINQRILSASNNTRASYPSINLSREAAEAARRNLQLVTDSYVQGIKSIIDLLDAQNQALNSDLDAANAVYNFLIDLMGVQRSIGQFIIFLPQEEQQKWLERAKASLK